MKKVLIIEDESEIRESVVEILSLEGYLVQEAGNGKDGLEKIQQFMPDVILCDIMMPDMTGYQLLENLNSNDFIRTIPFIFTTALTDRHYQRKGMELGADDYLTKPFSKNELLNAVKSRTERFDRAINYLKSAIISVEKELLLNLSKLEENSRNLEKEFQNSIEKQNQLSNKLEETNFELLSETLKFIDIKNVLHSLQNLIDKELKNKTIIDSQKTILVELNNRIQNKYTSIRDYAVFKFNFQNSMLISKLCSKYPNLTQYELFFISATKIGLSTVQISEILSISADSVRKSRSRLKKKLGLSKDDDFIPFIHSFNLENSDFH